MCKVTYAEKNYLRRNYIYWTVSTNYTTIYAYVFYASTTGGLGDYNPINSEAVVPVINIKTDNISYSGTGIEGDPIEIE